MDAREILKQIKSIEQGIREKTLKVERWKAIAEGMNSISEGERVQSSNDQQKMARAVSVYVDIQAEIEKDVDKLYELEIYITKTIEQLPTIEYDILHKMYLGRVRTDETGRKIIDYMSLKAIANEYKKSYSWAMKRHKNAIRKMQEIVDKSVDNEPCC